MATFITMNSGLSLENRCIKHSFSRNGARKEGKGEKDEVPGYEEREWKETYNKHKRIQLMLNGNGVAMQN